MNFLNRSKIDDRNAKALLAESYNELSHQFSTFTQLQEVGNYKILRQIGEGSFGKVFLAVHKLLHVKVVLKQGKKDDPNVVREVYYQREFKHPNITKLYEVIVTDCFIYMCIEWCPEGELYDHLIKFKRIPIQKIKKCFSQVCGSVYYIHQMNSCHRDLKLENILLDKKKNVKLSDFGFTRELPGKKDSNALLPQQNMMLETICGTTVYMAPEIIDRKPYSGVQVDIWSLGVILYTITYGGMPFDEDDDLKTKYKIINVEPTYREDVPPELIDLIKMLLQKNPQSRPASLAQVLSHPFLEVYGLRQLEIVENLLTKQTKPFQTKLEKNLLKKLSRVHIDTKSLVQSVNEHKSDSLCGIWSLMLEKEKKFELQKRRKLSRSRSVLRLSQAISTASPRGQHSRKGSCNANTLVNMLSHDREPDLNNAIQASKSNNNNNNNVVFDSYSQTLNDEPNVSSSKSAHSSTRVNTSNSSNKQDQINGKKRVSSVASAQDSMSSNKKNNILRKLSKLWISKDKKPKRDDLHEQPHMEQQRQQIPVSTTRKQVDQLNLEDIEPQILPEMTESPGGIKIALQTPPSMSRRGNGSAETGGRSVRPASMISTYSSYSQLTTMSENSYGSGNITSYSATDTHMPQQLPYASRPVYSRARSSDFSEYSRTSNGGKNSEPISSNSSTTNISRTTSVESSRSNSIKNRGRTRQLKKNNNFFLKRGKSPLGQSNRFLINKRKMGLPNGKKPTASVIEEEYESSLSNTTSNLSLNENAEPSNPVVSESFNETFELDIDDDGNYFGGKAKEDLVNLNPI